MRAVLRSRALVELLVSTFVALVALGVAMLLVAASGAPVDEALQALLDGSLGGRRQVGATLAETTLLAVLATGWCIAFASKRINVGLEGQAIMGGIAAATVAVSVQIFPGAQLLLVLVAGVAAGAVWASIAAWMWAKRGVNEIISTLMLNLVAVQVLAWVIRGPLRDPSQSYPQTEPFGDDSRWPNLLPESPLTWAATLLPLTVAAVWFVITRTVFGFRLRVAGENPDAARAVGISPMRAGGLALIISGALAGLAGATIAVGSQSAVLTDNFTAARGFEAIAVAMLARNRPLACVPAALLFAILQEGGGLMEARVGVSSSVVLVCQGLVIVLVAASAYIVEQGYTLAAQRATRLDAKQTAGA